MKKIVLLSLMLFITVAINAQNQRGFVSTGQNVNVRKGPGTNFPILTDGQYKYRLKKNDVVFDKGQKKNGFRMVELLLAEIPEPVVGWVSERYLRPVTLCESCGGWGIDGPDTEHLTKCEKCKGKGYVK